MIRGLQKDLQITTIQLLRKTKPLNNPSYKLLLVRKRYQKETALPAKFRSLDVLLYSFF